MPSTARELPVSARLVLLALGAAGPLLGFATFVLVTVFNVLPRHDLPLIALAGASSLIAAAATVLWSGRGITRPIKALSEAAEAFGRGEQPPTQPGGLREANETAAALRRVFDRLAKCEAARAVEEERYRAIPETAALRDAGARNEVEAARRHLKEQLHQSQKMEALGQLTGGIAHDFNNLLLAINLNLESLAEDVAASDMTAPLFAGARDAVEQGRALIGQLLAFGRRQSLRPVSFDVNAATLDTVMMLRRMLPAAISVHAPFGRDLWPVYADRNQLATALLNLALNARDAMPEGGRLDIKTANATVDRRAAAANPEAPAGDYVMIAICDTGAGMDAAVAARAFDPFINTKNSLL
jgi:signal transduction histidine kinase